MSAPKGAAVSSRSKKKKLKEQQDAVAERRARKGAPETIGTEAEDGDVETE